MQSHRHDRSTGVLSREISRILSMEIHDAAVSQVRVCKVVLSPDKRVARVLVAPWDTRSGYVPGPEPLAALERATGFIRKTLAQRLRMRNVPELQFEYDLGEQHASRIDTLLKRIKKRSQKGLKALFMLGIMEFGILYASEPLVRLESSAKIMGSEYRIACYADSKKSASGAITAAFDEIRRVDRFMSHYDPESELSHINREAPKQAIKISPEMVDLLSSCLHFSEKSEGAFDITVGALVKAWGFYNGNGSKPSLWSHWMARRNSGSEYLHVDHQQGTVRFLRSGLILDPGAIGKGYAVDKAVEVLRTFGIEHALISAGTSSIYALGSPPGDPAGWSLDIRNPFTPDQIAEKVHLKNESISTSGAYEKYFEVDNRRYSHILDPRSGSPVEGMAAVSVITPKTIDSEVWATALFVNGVDWALNHPVPDSHVFICPQESGCRWLP